MIVDSAERQKVDSEREFVFNVRYSGVPETLRMTLFMDDVDSPEVSFFGSPALIDPIGAEIRKFTEEQSTEIKSPTPVSEIGTPEGSSGDERTLESRGGPSPGGD